MREMKDSGVEWIGAIPQSYSVIRMRYLINDYKAGPFGSALITDNLLSSGNILCYTPEHIANQSTENEKNLFLPESRLEEMAQFLVKPGDVIFPIVGSLGRAMVITEDMPSGIINQRLAKFSVDAGKIDIDYFMWLFAKSTFFQPYIDLFQRGSIIVNLTKSIVYDMPFVIPPTFHAQTQLVSFLDKKNGQVDSLISNVQFQIEKLKSYKQSLISEVATKGLDPTVSMKPTEKNEWITAIPKHWEECRIKNAIFPQEKAIVPSDQIITCFRDGEVTLRSKRREDGFTLSLTEHGYHGVDVGDLVIHGMDAFAGAIGCSDSRGKTTPVVHVCSTVGNNRYFMYYLRAMAYGNILMDLSNGVRIRSSDYRNFDRLGVFGIVIPPRNEQDEIADYLDRKCVQIEQLISIKQAKIEKLEQYKRSLIYEYVTGKKEVPTQA